MVAAAATVDSAKNLVLRDSEFELELVALLAQRRPSAESDFGWSRQITKLFKLPLPPSLRRLAATSGTADEGGRQAEPGW